MDKGTKIFIATIIFAWFCNMYIRNDMQHQIDELHKENIKQNMRIGILKRILYENMADKRQ